MIFPPPSGMLDPCQSSSNRSVPIKTLNRFSTLSDAPTEKPDESALVIGDSIVRNVKT